MASQFSPLFSNALPLDTKRGGGNNRRYFNLARRTRKVRKLFIALIGAVSGGTATQTSARITASTTENGGKRPVAVVTEMSRVTTATDVTNLKNYLQKTSRIATPTNKGWPNRLMA